LSTPGSGWFYGWRVAATSVSIYFFTNGMTLFVPQNLFPRFIETFDATAGDVSLTTGLSLGLAALLAPFVGAVVDRAGVLRALRTGLLVMAVCVSLYPFARSLTDLYVLHAGLALGLVLSGLLVNVVLLSNWFVARRGAVVGMLAAGSSLACALLPVAISPAVNDPELGWRWGYGALAAGFWLLAVLPGFTVLRETPATVGAFPDGGAAPPPASGSGELDGVEFAAALRTPALWCLAIGSACLWFSIQSMNSQVTIYFEQEAGLAPARATLLFSVIFWFSFVGKFLFGALSDRMPKRRVMLLASLVLLIGCLLPFEAGDEGLGLTSDLTRLSVFAAVFGLGFGGSFTMIQLVTVEVFGQRSLGKILGIVTLIDALGAAAGTVLTGKLQTATGSYLTPFLMIAAVAAVAVINVLFIRPVIPAREATPGKP
jgi:MFS family permease